MSAVSQPLLSGGSNWVRCPEPRDMLCSMKAFADMMILTCTDHRELWRDPDQFRYALDVVKYYFISTSMGGTRYEKMKIIYKAWLRQGDLTMTIEAAKLLSSRSNTARDVKDLLSAGLHAVFSQYFHLRPSVVPDPSRAIDHTLDAAFKSANVKLLHVLCLMICVSFPTHFLNVHGLAAEGTHSRTLLNWLKSPMPPELRDHSSIGSVFQQHLARGPATRPSEDEWTWMHLWMDVDAPLVSMFIYMLEEWRLSEQLEDLTGQNLRDREKDVLSVFQMFVASLLSQLRQLQTYTGYINAGLQAVGTSSLTFVAMLLWHWAMKQFGQGATAFLHSDATSGC